MTITTKTGDDGTTELKGARITKTSSSIELMLLGKLDTLNAALGRCLDSKEPEGLFGNVNAIQQKLIEISGIIALNEKSDVQYEIRWLETEMTKLESKIPLMEFKGFLTFHGSHYATDLHFARAICREAELYAWDWLRQIARDKKSQIPIYLNRLSDWLFVQAENIE